MELREYQTELINNIRNELYKGKKNICAVLGCGGGKSVIQGKSPGPPHRKRTKCCSSSTGRNCAGRLKIPSACAEWILITAGLVWYRRCADGFPG